MLSTTITSNKFSWTSLFIFLGYELCMMTLTFAEKITPPHNHIKHKTNALPFVIQVYLVAHYLGIHTTFERVVQKTPKIVCLLRLSNFGIVKSYMYEISHNHLQ